MKSIMSNLRYNAAIRSSKSRLDSKKLKAYLQLFLRDNDFQTIRDIDLLKVSNIKKIGGGLVNELHSFLLTYSRKGDGTKKLRLIIKIYIENPYFHDSNLNRCIKEWQVLKSLELAGLTAPRPCFYTLDSSFLGYPFLIMTEIERSQKKPENHWNRFAVSLAHLHNLEIDRLDLEAFEFPKNGYAFARSMPIRFRNTLDIETKHSARLKIAFNSAIDWLELNASNNYCPKYSLIHGDAHPANALLNKDSQIALMDWESAEIGDSAFDVGYAYHLVKFFSSPSNPDSAEQIAERFLFEYLRESKKNIRSRFDFYQVVGILGLSILFSSSFSSPILAYKLYGPKFLPSIPLLKLPLIILAFPFLNYFFVANQLGAEGGLYWLKYFEKFMENLN